MLHLDLGGVNTILVNESGAENDASETNLPPSRAANDGMTAAKNSAGLSIDGAGPHSGMMASFALGIPAASAKPRARANDLPAAS
jgi:hypothetical protein